MITQRSPKASRKYANEVHRTLLRLPRDGKSVPEVSTDETFKTLVVITCGDFRHKIMLPWSRLQLHNSVFSLGERLQELQILVGNIDKRLRKLESDR